VRLIRLPYDVVSVHEPLLIFVFISSLIIYSKNCLAVPFSSHINR
jgi:hypothetical protein